jgi:hypothetical protein
MRKKTEDSSLMETVYYIRIHNAPLTGQMLLLLLTYLTGCNSSASTITDKLSKLKGLINRSDSNSRPSFEAHLAELKQQLVPPAPSSIFEYFSVPVNHSFRVIPFYVIAVKNESSTVSPSFLEYFLFAIGLRPRPQLPKVGSGWTVGGNKGTFVFRLRYLDTIAKLTFARPTIKDCLATTLSVWVFGEAYEKVGEFRLDFPERFQEFTIEKVVKDAIGFRVEVDENRGNANTTCLPEFGVFAAI